MLTIDIPGWKRLELEHLVLDVNGTLALDGSAVPGVAECIEALREHLDILLLTADTHGRGALLAEELGVPWHRLEQIPGTEAAQKRAVVEGLGAQRVVAVGNGRNDIEMLRAAALAIAVLGGEGAALDAIRSADVLVAAPADALDLLLHPKRLVATLRG